MFIQAVKEPLLDLRLRDSFLQHPHVMRKHCKCQTLFFFNQHIILRVFPSCCLAKALPPASTTLACSRPNRGANPPLPLFCLGFPGPRLMVPLAPPDPDRSLHIALLDDADAPLSSAVVQLPTAHHVLAAQEVEVAMQTAQNQPMGVPSWAEPNLDDPDQL